MAERITIQYCNLDKRKKQIGQWKIPASTKRELLEFLEQLELGKVNRGKKISTSRQLKYLSMLKTPLEFLNKSTARLTVADLERFEKALSTGKVVSSQHRRPYRHNTQVDIRKLLRIFLRWRLGDAKALPLTSWFDTHDQPKTPEFLSEQEIDKLYKACGKPEHKFLIAVLFDAGARAQEFHNIRMEDVFLAEGRENFTRIALKEEYSKTLGRTIALYWKNSAEAVRDFILLRKQMGAKSGDPVFNISYLVAKKFLRRLGQRVLQRNIYYHLFRHSSATYYATKLNRQELCYRYGWKFSSPMPDIYISRAGMETKALDEKFTQTELSSLKDELAKVDQAARIKDDRIKQMEQAMERIETQLLETVGKIVRKNPTINQVEAALERKTG
ncbi:MAG: site-specific integrase [Verrucomicrobia bacterium]|nr:site-specific integrase [Verrucomicrobiota bacterium]